MKSSKYLFVLILLVVALMIFAAACSSSNAPAPSSNEASNEIQLNAPENSPDDILQAQPSSSQPSDVPSPSEESSPSVSPSEPSPSASQAPVTEKNSLYDFESDLQSWNISNYESANDGERAGTGVNISKDQKASGSSSAAISCSFTGAIGSSKKAKAAFKITFPAFKDLTGRTIKAKIFIPNDLTSGKYKGATYGFKLYVKTTDQWSWKDGGWIEMAKLKPGWNEASFSPKGCNENMTKEVGIQITKGDKSPDWSGTIYVDDVSF